MPTKINVLIVANEPPPTHAESMALLHNFADGLHYENNLRSALATATGKTSYDLIVIDPSHADEFEIRNFVDNARVHLQSTRGIGPTIVATNDEDIPDNVPMWADFKLGTALFDNYMKSLVKK